MLRVCGVGVCECYVCVVWEYVSVACEWCGSM